MANKNILLAKISAVRRKRRRVGVTSGLFRVIAAAVMLLILIFLLDWGFNVSRIARLVILVAAFGILASVIWNSMVRRLQEYMDDDEIALMVEKHHPELEGRLISTIQLQRKGKEELGGASEELIAALEDETLNYTGGFRFSEIITLRNMLRVFGVALLFLLIVVLFGIYAPETGKILLARLALADKSYPTKTKINKITGDVLADRGDLLTLTLEAVGIIPGEAVFHVRFRESDWSKNFVFREGGDSNTFEFTVARLVEPFQYYAEVGDAKTPMYNVKLLDRPEVFEIKVKVSYPAYTGWGEVENEPGSGEVRALTGSKAFIKVKTTKKVASAYIEFAKGEKTPMKVGDDGLWAEGVFTVADLENYAVKVVDSNGLDNKDPARYPVIVIKDTEPAIAITKPKMSKRVTPRSAWDISYEIRDDFGVSSAWLVYTVNEDERRNRMQVTFRKDTGKLFTGQYGFDINRLNVVPTDTVRFWIEADDNMSGQPNRGKSEALEFIIVTVEEKRIEILERWKNALDTVQTIITEESDSKKGVDTIRSKK